MSQENITNIIREERQKKLLHWIVVVLVVLLFVSVVYFFFFKKENTEDVINDINQYPKIESDLVTKENNNDSTTTTNQKIEEETYKSVGIAILDIGPTLDYNFTGENSGFYINKDGEIRTFNLLLNNGYNFITNKLYKINKDNIISAVFSIKSKYLLIKTEDNKIFVYKNNTINTLSFVQVLQRDGVLHYTFSNDEKYLYYSTPNDKGGSSVMSFGLDSFVAKKIIDLPIVEYVLYSNNDGLFAKTKTTDMYNQNVLKINTNNNTITNVSDGNNDSVGDFVRKKEKIYFKNEPLNLNTSLEKCFENNVYIFCFYKKVPRFSIDDWYKKKYKVADELFVYNKDFKNIINTSKIYTFMDFEINSIKGNNKYFLFINGEDKEFWVSSVDYLLN